MNSRKLILPALLGSAGLALALRSLAGKRNRAKPPLPQMSPTIHCEEIDGYVTQHLKRLNLPGAALVVVEGDRIVHRRGFGLARPGGEPPSPQTPFCIGSLTKSFTALAVMQLAEAGKLDLDAPVRTYLPWFQLADRLASERITLRHLLNQTGGLPLSNGWRLLSDFDESPDAAERQARALSSVKLSRPAGEAFEYSNLNYNLLGLVIEAASGESYTNYIQGHIFDPLRMHHSHTSKASASRDGLAAGHQSWFGFPVAVPGLPMPNGSLASGQLIASAEDLGHYLIAQLNEGRFEGARILSPAGVAEMHQPAVETRLLEGENGWYGMGWYVVKQEGERVIFHSGLTPDFYAFAVMLPEQKRGLVLLVNADHFTMQLTMAEVGMGAAALLAGRRPVSNLFVWTRLIPWVQRALLLVPLLQLIDVLHTVKRNDRGQEDAGHRSSGRKRWEWDALLSCMINLPAALALIPALGKLRGFLKLFAPDFIWTARICGGFACALIFLRGGLLRRILYIHRRPSPCPLPPFPSF